MSDAGKFGGVVASIPQPIVAAILSITFGMVGKYAALQRSLGLYLAVLHETS